MWRLATAVTAALASASCASAGADRDAGGPVPTTASPGTPVQAVAAALAFAAHDDPEVAVVDGYATLPSAVQRGERPIDPAGGHANRWVLPRSANPQPLQGFALRRRPWPGPTA